MATASHESAPPRTALGTRLILSTISAAWIVYLATQVIAHHRLLHDSVMELIPWLVLIVVVNLLPVEGWQSTNLSVDVPIAVAATLVLSPIQTGAVLFLGAFDLRELRGTISPTKAVFNRSQIALADYCGALAAHAFTETPSHSDFVIPLALISLAAMAAANYLLVGVVLSVEQRIPFREVVRRLRLGTAFDYALTFVAWGVLGAMLAVLYERLGALALAAFLAPTFMARQTLMKSEMYLRFKRAYRAREEAVHELARRTQEERADERRIIAADLHDEVLQPLFKVSLMGQVLKADLSSGRLLDLDRDVPELLDAADAATTTLRGVIGNLRHSPLGMTGLTSALKTLIRTAQGPTRAHIHSDVAFVETDHRRQLAVYQIAKEALANSLEHSGADEIWIELSESDTAIRLAIRDNGSGFDPYTEKPGHYGLHIMRERAATVNGHLLVEPVRNRGTTVTLTLPRTD